MKRKTIFPPSISAPAFCWLCALLLIALQACETVPNEDVAEFPLEIDFLRSDQQMMACAKALQENSELSDYEAYQTYLSSERDFFAELMGLAPRFKQLKLTESQQDSILARNLGPMLRDSFVYVVLDTVRQAFPESKELTANLLPPLKRLKKAFPEIELPAFRTHINGYNANGDLRSADQVLP
ncbi:MAG: hypothetical protein AAF206_29665, partial [Bacteroidota bacterium]